jgi:molybdenum cofactor biosynthesis protein B
MTSTPDQHRQQAAERGPIRCAVLSVSDTRTEKTDRGGPLVVEKLTEAGHTIELTDIVKDDVQAIQESLDRIRDLAKAQVVILTGGTGVSDRDVTPEAVNELLDKRLEGFGELFRQLSFAEIGSAALLSRALAGVMGGVVIFVLPGSPAAVHLAMEKLILPELRHIVDQANR